MGKYQNVSFGRCPRFYCQGQPVLPVGLSDVPRCYSVSVYCPCCQDVFHPKSSKQAHLDGAYFGTTFCHLFLLTNPDIVIHRYQFTYVPRIYGFRISESSQYFQRREGSGAIREESIILILTPILRTRTLTVLSTILIPSMETLLKGKNDRTSRIIHASSVVLASECEYSRLCGREDVDDFIPRNFSDKSIFSVHQSCYTDS